MTRPPHTAVASAPTAAAQDPAARLEAVHERLTAAIADLTSAENWQLMLRTAAMLPTYSPHNVLLITSQFPQASAVAGFHTWKQLGRAVRKGEKGLAILAPVQRRTSTREPSTQPGTSADHPTGPAAQETAGHVDGASPIADAVLPQGCRVVGFRVVHVFDISQTDGPDLPEPPRPVLLDGQAPAGLLDGLTQQVTDEGYGLVRHDFDIPHPGVGVPNGVTMYFARTVLVRPDLSDAQTAKTLAHELGHVLLHEPTIRPADLTRAAAEVEAESVAYVVAAAHGLDTSGYTIPYVAGWSEGNLELLARSAERVIATSHTILTRTPPPPTLTLPDGLRERAGTRDIGAADRTTSTRTVGDRSTDPPIDRHVHRPADRGRLR
ncbi:MAG: ImmA/IrrE family metallo-endopeptidase [Frankiales bacterium]|nr:ImmA/IrrE family metallo-endopeptidase [Frankiales bacterium]